MLAYNAIWYNKLFLSRFLDIMSRTREEIILRGMIDLLNPNRLESLRSF
jgi:hypothetical protein